MTMIKVQSYTTNGYLAVNPHQVTYVKEVPNGCVIYFVGEKSIHVKDEYLEVTTAIGNCL